MRLLLAEDEKALSNALVTILKHNHYSVDAVYNGQDALDYLKYGTYDGVILDIMMPKVDGITVLKTIREQGNSIPVLLLTAKSEVEDKVSGLDAGADDYLTKPFHSQELLARIRAMLRRKVEVENTTLVYEDLSLDRTSFELICHKKKILLTAKEYQIMEMLMKEPNHIISIDTFMEKIWGYDSDTENGVVWTYISYLRKKIKSLGSVTFIKAVRNVGYTLEKEHD